MTRQQIFELIDAVRAEQDQNWPDRSQYKRSAAHVLVLQQQMDKLGKEWYASDLPAILNRFKSIATVAVRALEEIDPEA